MKVAVKVFLLSLFCLKVQAPKKIYYRAQVDVTNFSDHCTYKSSFQDNSGKEIEEKDAKF